MKAVYSSSNLEQIIWYVLVPLTVALLIFTLFSYFYNLAHYKKRPNHTNYVINFWSSVLGIIFGAMLLAAALGFSLAFIQNVQELNLVAEKQFFYYFFMVFPIIPFIFLIVSIRRFLLNLSKRHIANEEEEMSVYEVK